MHRLLLAVSAIFSLAFVAPNDGGALTKYDATSLAAALDHCGPGELLAGCLTELRAQKFETGMAEGRILVPINGGVFHAISLDVRGGERIVDVAFRGTGIAPLRRGEIARFIEEHAGAFPFSEKCRRGAAYCGVLYPKQQGGAGAVEIGVGLIQVTGQPVWRKPPTVRINGKSIYAPQERVLDIEHTPAVDMVVQFSLPLGRDGQPLSAAPLLRPAFTAFIRAPFLR